MRDDVVDGRTDDGVDSDGCGDGDVDDKMRVAVVVGDVVTVDDDSGIVEAFDVVLDLVDVTVTLGTIGLCVNDDKYSCNMV